MTLILILTVILIVTLILTWSNDLQLTKSNHQNHQDQKKTNIDDGDYFFFLLCSCRIWKLSFCAFLMIYLISFCKITKW